MTGHKKYKKITNLTNKDLESPGVAKFVINENETLKKSLRETQDRLEKIKEEKFEHEKKNIILETKQKSIFWIEFFKFISSVGIGFAISYIFSGNNTAALSFGIPSVIIFIIALIVGNK